jgi:hypothetical protein
MANTSEAVANAKTDLDRLGPEIDGWTNDFLELLRNVTDLDLIFQEGETMDLNYLALCRWDDPSNLVVMQTFPVTQTAEERKRTLATTSTIAALLYESGHYDVAIALLADKAGKMFRHEGVTGRCRAIGGCLRVPTIESKFDFSSISGHIARGTSPALSN